VNEWEWQLLEDKTPVDRLTIGETEIGMGDCVLLHPRQVVMCQTLR
jgi:hypothetical protein